MHGMRSPARGRARADSRPARRHRGCCGGPENASTNRSIRPGADAVLGAWRGVASAVAAGRGRRFGPRRPCSSGLLVVLCRGCQTRQLVSFVGFAVDERAVRAHAFELEPADRWLVLRLVQARSTAPIRNRTSATGTTTGSTNPARERATCRIPLWRAAR